ncbi:glucarate dehydratase [Verminephrobacter aporrectodeae subsp. tuberculatae]|uniref:enolase C-terminal domain-like protein n=1 Tax=Verminephrobacter aporrectodeae TaxID=1110389 RepID=UPI0022390EB5|nr:enolase C-terminal domain-like protein [Verminephrobacter aporrectodeae]MCW5256856.1 glucarate dehydratase [Verminephrobacter aporrectodeae subsp. tuberculatae]MCW8166071.1 glucarate dehydratase [Verminephrobacter aporrectodeae subsp. tuberculatae]MCW8170730.1 glucarate dehydratase [Verminephrobacter aporrectodeae subsp. tuberculatae]
MKISAIRVTPIAIRDPALLNAAGVHEPFGLRSIIEVEGANGLVGLGETYGDAALLSLLTRCQHGLAGGSAFDLHRLWQQVQRHAAQAMAQTTAHGEMELAPGSLSSHLASSAYSAFEVAFLDLQARTLGIPLVDLLGGKVRDKVAYSAYLFYKWNAAVDPEYAPDPYGEALNPAQIVAQAQSMIAQYGFESIKLKAGVMDPMQEADAILALKAAFPGRPLRIDPNGNWSLATSLKVADRLQGSLEYYEDPTPTLEGMAQVHRASGMPLATNMVVTNWSELRRAVPLDAVQILLSDHHYWGGLRATQALAKTCEAFGLGLSMHSNSHLGISLMAMTHLAASVQHLSYACDTHYPWQSDEVLVGGKLPIVGGCVHLTDKPGLGVELDPHKLAELHDAFKSCRIRTRNDVAQMQRYRPDWRQIKPRF